MNICVDDLLELLIDRSCQKVEIYSFKKEDVIAKGYGDSFDDEILEQDVTSFEVANDVLTINIK